MKKLLFLVLVPFLLFSVAMAETKDSKKDDKKKKVYWIDVRADNEFEDGHIKGAINIDYNMIRYKIKKVTKDKEAEIHLYCKSGYRAGKALETLKAMGYTKVTNDGKYEEIKARLKKEAEEKKKQKAKK